MSLFNSKGELNASNVQDALQLLAKYASVLEDNMPANVGLAGQLELTDSQRDELMSQAIYGGEGKLALAQAMANPIN